MASHYFGKKVKLDGYTFDSKKEAQFYLQFVKPSGMRFDVHPHYRVIDLFPMGGYLMRGMTYTPDFVLKRPDGSIAHVYDVKAGFTSYSVSTASRLRFKLFALRYHVPVECVIVRKHDFRVKILGFTTKLDEYQRQDVNYDLTDIIGC
jgi:hypothetical protein